MSPRPSAGAWASVSNGLVTNDSRLRKKIPMPIITAITMGMSSRLRWRFTHTTSEAKPLRIQAHSSSDPAWLPQRAVSL